MHLCTTSDTLNFKVKRTHKKSRKADHEVVIGGEGYGEPECKEALFFYDFPHEILCLFKITLASLDFYTIYVSLISLVRGSGKLASTLVSRKAGLW